MPNHEISLSALDLVYNAGIVVKAIMLGLLFASVSSWAIILLKRQLLKQATLQNDAFLKGFWGGWNLSESFSKAADYPYSPVAKSFQAAVRELRKLGEDGDRIEQEYVAEVAGAIAEDGLARLNRGGRPNAPIKASWQSEARLRFAGKGIAPGQIEALCGEVGLQVTALRRLRIGRVALGSLPLGQWRYLKDIEKF